MHFSEIYIKITHKIKSSLLTKLQTNGHQLNTSQNDGILFTTDFVKSASEASRIQDLNSMLIVSYFVQIKFYKSIILSLWPPWSFL